MSGRGRLHAWHTVRTWSEASRHVRDRVFVAGPAMVIATTAVATTVRDVSNGLRDRVRSGYHLDPCEEIQALDTVAEAQSATARAARARRLSGVECSEPP